MHHVTIMAQEVGVQFMPCWSLPEYTPQTCYLLRKISSSAVTAEHHNAGPAARNRLHERNISDRVNYGGSCEIKQNLPAAVS